MRVALWPSKQIVLLTAGLHVTAIGCLQDETYLHLVLEFVPDTVYRISKYYTKNNQRMPSLYVKLYTYQVSWHKRFLYEEATLHKPWCSGVGNLELAAISGNYQRGCHSHGLPHGAACWHASPH